MLQLSGTLRLADGGWLLREGRRVLEGGPRDVTIDLTRVDRAEGGPMALLVQLARELRAAGRRVGIAGPRPEVAAVLALFDAPVTPSEPTGRRDHGVLEQAGRAIHGLGLEARGALTFLGQLLRAVAAALRAPRSVQWSELRPLCAAAGTDALFIVLTINLLVGLILGFQAAAQLHRFGADIFVADLVGLSVVRELGPIMTAIIVCGRSGASIAATLGSMKVSEEVDALTVLGFDPLRFLVLPRVVALLIVLPPLTLLGDIVGVTGGFLVGVLGLDLTSTSYLNETRAAMDLWDFGQGLVKSLAFALAIALIASQQGLATSGGAEGVGRRTTSAVVTIILSLVVIDACFTCVFFVWDL